MPFEPLRTDEKLEQPIKREDIDAHLMRGLVAFGFVAGLTYLFIAVPFFVVKGLETPDGLRTAGMIGGIPSLILGLLGARLGKVAGGSGFVAGALIAAAFLYMKLRQIVLFAGKDEMPPLEWNPVLTYVIPICLIAISILVFFVATPRKEYSLKSSG